MLANGFYAAFGFPAQYHIDNTHGCKNTSECIYIWSDILSEFCFLIEIIITFFIEFKSEEKLQPIRDIGKISERYLQGTFLIDLISFFPFILAIKSFDIDSAAVSFNDFGYL